MKNIAKILVVAMLLASVLMFTACGGDNNVAERLDGMQSVRAVVVTGTDGARGQILLSPVAATNDIPAKFIVYAENNNVFFAADADDNFASASGIDLIGWSEEATGTSVTVYFNELPEDLEDAETPVLENAIIIIDRTEADGEED